MQKSVRKVDALFMGFQKSGKTNFITSIVLASRSSRLKVKTTFDEQVLSVEETKSFDVSHQRRKPIEFFDGRMHF